MSNIDMAEFMRDRENMRWLDYADEGLHLACFTDPKFQETVVTAALSKIQDNDHG